MADDKGRPNLHRRASDARMQSIVGRAVAGEHLPILDELPAIVSIAFGRAWRQEKRFRVGDVVRARSDTHFMGSSYGSPYLFVKKGEEGEVVCAKIGGDERVAMISWDRLPDFPTAVITLEIERVSDGG